MRSVTPRLKPHRVAMAMAKAMAKAMGGQRRGLPAAGNASKGISFVCCCCFLFRVAASFFFAFLFGLLRAFSAKAFANLHLNWPLSPWAAASWRRQ